MCGRSEVGSKFPSKFKVMYDYIDGGMISVYAYLGILSSFAR